MAKIAVLHGPNLNLLGSREPEVYGSQTLEEINQLLTAQAKALGLEVICQQSNAEHVLVEAIQNTHADFLIFNPAAFTHTSVALRDALLSVKLPFIECHLSNPHAREPFRQQSYFSDIAKAVICGLGVKSYEVALQAANEFLKTGS